MSRRFQVTVEFNSVSAAEMALPSHSAASDSRSRHWSGEPFLRVVRGYEPGGSSSTTKEIDLLESLVKANRGIGRGTADARGGRAGKPASPAAAESPNSDYFLAIFYYRRNMDYRPY